MPQLSIALREPMPRAVALVQALTGIAQAGPELGKLGPVAVGSQFIAGDVVTTDEAAAARLALADGSFDALRGETTLRIGRVELTAELKRTVKLELIKGQVEAIAEFKGAGSSFDVFTTTGLAGVLGTRLRVRMLSSGGTGVECFRGASNCRRRSAPNTASRSRAVNPLRSAPWATSVSRRPRMPPPKTVPRPLRDFQMPRRTLPAPTRTRQKAPPAAAKARYAVTTTPAPRRAAPMASARLSPSVGPVRTATCTLV